MEAYDVTDKEENAGETSSFLSHDKNHMVFPVRENFAFSLYENAI